MLAAAALLLVGVVATVGAEPAARPGGAVARPPAELLARAERGDSWAQLNVGAAFDHGAGGFPLDPVRAVGWYRRAAEAGLAEAQFNLAHCLATGNGTPRDDVAALGWMLRAAQQGLASAQYLGGVMFAEGLGTPVDRQQARYWLRLAAENGNADAAAMLQRLSGNADPD